MRPLSRRARRTSGSLLVFAWTALAALGALDCSAKQAADPAALRSAFASANARFTEAFARRDPAAMSLFYAEDAQVFPPNAAPVSGRQAIRELWKGFLEAPVGRLQLETVEADGSDLSAWETGRYTLLGTNGSTVDEGKYIGIWRREESGWKVLRWMWSSSMPATAPARADTTR